MHERIPLSVVLLVVGSAFLHAVWNAILKREAKPELAGGAISFISAVTAVAFALFTTRTMPTWDVLLWSVGSGLFEAGYFITLSKALARAPLGTAYTIARGGALLITWPVSIVVHGERFTLAALAGSALVAGGLAAVGMRGAGAVPASRERMRAGMAWAGACALFIAGYHLFYKCAMNAHGDPPAVTAVSLAVAMLASFAWHGRAGTAQILDNAKKSPLPIVVAGTLCTASFIAFLGALEHGGAGAIMTLRNTSVLFAQAFAWLSGERSRPAQIAGALAVFAGAVCIAWP